MKINEKNLKKLKKNWKWESQKGSIEAGLFASVWIPLNFPAPVEQKDNNIIADITISNIYELKSLLIVDDQPTTSMQGQSTSGNMRSLKLKASRANGFSNGPLTSSSMSSSAMHLSSGCFSTSKNKTAAPYSKRFLSPPDLENDASNASDGSWFVSSFKRIISKNLQFVIFNGILWINTTKYKNKNQNLNVFVGLLSSPTISTILLL